MLGVTMPHVGGQVLQCHIRGALTARNIHRAIALAFTSVGGQVLQCHIRGALTTRNIRTITLAFTSGGYTKKDIAEYFGVHDSIVSRVVK